MYIMGLLCLLFSGINAILFVVMVAQGSYGTAIINLAAGIYCGIVGLRTVSR